MTRSARHHVLTVELVGGPKLGGFEGRSPDHTVIVMHACEQEGESWDIACELLATERAGGAKAVGIEWCDGCNDEESWCRRCGQPSEGHSFTYRTTDTEDQPIEETIQQCAACQHAHRDEIAAVDWGPGGGYTLSIDDST